MHVFYSFDFFKTITDQLIERLEHIDASNLNDDALSVLQEYQNECGSSRGVYCLVNGEESVYLGKADNVSDRLKQHLKKLSGRENIELSNVKYKAILLDKSMSTAANEKLLIDSFKTRGHASWNGNGFGAKDPGQRRDTTKPNDFDREHPIRADIVLDDISDTETVESVLLKLKASLPYVVRWDKGKMTAEEARFEVDLRGKGRDAKTILKTVGETLGTGWQAVMLSYGMILYKNSASYTHGVRIFPE